MSKYHNTKINGYDSKAEAKRGFELELLERAGKIENLRRQVSFELIPKQDGERAVSYVADFAYWQDGKLIVEDVKGVRTSVYNLKRKLMLWVHNIRILET